MNHSNLDIAAIKARYNIVDVAARYFSVTRRGVRSVALCPFHADRHPSLTLSPNHASYHCFACGAKGDIFSLVQQMEHCTFMEAVARITGGTFTTQTPHALPPLPEAVLSPETAAENVRFLQSLIPYTPACAALREAYRALEVGIAPTSPAVPPYETYSLRRLAGRLIFPIRSKTGELVGFSGRLLTDGASPASANKAAPKYLNSSFADGFAKGAHLYALHRALPFVQQTRKLYLVEGYKDALAMHAAGFPNTVALGGTALTPQHIALLTSLAPQLYVLLDGDAPGIAAAQQVVKQLLHIVTTRIVVLPDGEDPDSLMQKHGIGWFYLFLSDK